LRLDALGDVLMTTPALRAVRETGGGRRVTLLTSSSGADAARLIPWVDEVIVYDAPWLKATAPRCDAAPDHAMIDRLARGGFDAAVIFTVYSQIPLPSALLCYLVGIPRRLAYCRENPYQLLTDWVVESEPDRGIRHEVRRQLDLVARVGFRGDDERMAIRVPEPARRSIDTYLDAEGFGRDRSWVVIHPGATAPSRRYPPESYAAVAQQLVTEHRLRVVFTGSRSEAELINRIRRMIHGARSRSLARTLDLPELAALIARTPLLLSNNTGPVHLASALGTPVVDLFALTNPQHVPWRVAHRVLNHDVPCKYCYKSICPEGHHDCLRLVTPAEVVQAVLELLGEAAAPLAPATPRAANVVEPRVPLTVSEVTP
jgi:lipopolysaccharide heptosyltransferase II